MVASELDEAVWSRVLSVIADSDVLLREVEAQLSQPDTTPKDLEALDRELARIDRQEKGTANAISLLNNEEAYAPLSDKLQLLAIQKKQLEVEREIVSSKSSSFQTFLEIVEKIERDLAAEEASVNLSYEERRAILHFLGVKVKLWKMKHSPRYQIVMTEAGEQYFSDPRQEPEPRQLEEGFWLPYVPQVVFPDPYQSLLMSGGQSHSRDGRCCRHYFVDRAD